LLVTAAVGSLSSGISVLVAYLGAVLAGVVAGPLLLPWLPGRSFAVKGAVAGLIWSGLFYALSNGFTWNAAVTAALFFTLPVVSSFYTLNFTGCSTYTSRSGVKKEMRIALPAMGGSLLLGLVLLLVGRFL
jgi:acetyl-CoA decarbonylase/synthase complex subunit gamma